MNETATTTANDLDRLAERVERAAALVQQLRDDRARLERERDDLISRSQDVNHKLQGQDPAALLGELAALRKEQKEWISERREIAHRIETLIKKLEKLET
jgi:chromosome segregation ATPase